jgi:hypothetical protein
VHKVSTGGFAERRLQRVAEETWAQNAKLTAQAVATAAANARAEFVVLGGDVKERAMVLELLPADLREAAVIVDSEVAPDAAAFNDAARDEAERRTNLEGRARLEEFATRISGAEPGSRRAVDGLDDTLAALRDGLVSHVLLAGAPVSALSAWIGPGMADAAAGEEQLAAFGVTSPVRDRADAALARSAAGTGASLHLLRTDADTDTATPLPRDGIGALLRGPLSAV